MVKKLFLLALGLIAASGMMAQSASKSVTIVESNIQYWVGNGSNSSVVAIGWDATGASYTPTVVVWGIHWNGSITLLDALDSIATHDSRFTYTVSGSYLSTLEYNDVDAGVHLTPYQYWNCNNYNGVYGSTTLTSTWLRISESTCDNYNFTGVNNLIYASNPNNSGNELPDTVDASLPFSEILYWIGSGTDSAEFIVNFAQPDTAFAWGYLFNGTTTAQAMVDAIAAADPRFWTVGSPSVSGNIHFVTSTGDTLGLSPVDPSVGYNFWWTNLNGVSTGSGAASTLHNGDVFKYGDINSATGWDDWGGFYMEEAWNTIPTPVPVPGNTPDTPTDASFAASDILYWVGEGSNEVVLAINWADTALAWGYRFNGEKTVNDMMTDIAAADPRFSFTMNGSYLSDINFTAGSTTLGVTTGNFWWSLLNHESGMGMIDDLTDGDFYKWGDLSVAVIADSTWVPDWGGYWDYAYTWPYTIYPVSIPDPVEPSEEDASIAASAIEYWVGEGSNEVVLAINWADTALAWGYRFNGTKTVNDMMTDIAAAVPRLSFTMDGIYLGDINFTIGNTTLGVTPGNYWYSLLNHVGGMGMADNLANGDFYKWGDLSVAVIVDSTWVPDWGGYWDYAYVWTHTIYAVTQPAGMGPFCGAAGTDGSTAIAYNDNRIKAWATGCSIVRGSQNLTDPNAPEVTYGDESEAIGAATTSTMDVVSLGDGGTATLTFEKPITNGEGYDFAVFENSFNDYFLELAFVEVSSDGQRFVRFPATSLTQTARQVVSSVDPTYINNLAGKYRVGFGTPFDLNELRDSTGIDINNITHVRIVDVVGSIDPELGTYDAFGHIVNDPFPTVSYSAGFDLDGIAVLNQKGEGIELAENGTLISVSPNPATDRLCITLNSYESTEATLFDVSGRAVMTITLHNGANTVDINALQNGVYIIRAAGNVTKVVKK